MPLLRTLTYVSVEDFPDALRDRHGLLARGPVQLQPRLHQPYGVGARGSAEACEIGIIHSKIGTTHVRTSFFVLAACTLSPFCIYFSAHIQKNYVV